jgi:hypothetical protein
MIKEGWQGLGHREGCVNVTFEQCNPRVAFVSRVDVFVAFQIIESSHFFVYPRRDVLRRD